MIKSRGDALECKLAISHLPGQVAKLSENNSQRRGGCQVAVNTHRSYEMGAPGRRDLAQAPTVPLRRQRGIQGMRKY